MPDRAGLNRKRQHTSNDFTGQRSFPGQEVSKTASKGCPKRHLLHRVDHVTVSRFFLACAAKCHEICCPPPPTLSFTTFSGPKYRKPKMASHDLRARSFEDGCLCSILHGPLQLQIRTAFLFPRQSATRLSHTTFSQLSEPTPGSSSTCTLLFPFPACFSALYCSPHLHKRAIVAITPQTPLSPLLCGCSQLVRLAPGILPLEKCYRSLF